MRGVGVVLATLETFDPGTNTWSSKLSMPTARAGLACEFVDGILYAIDRAVYETNYPFGTTLEPLREVERFDSRTGYSGE